MFVCSDEINRGLIKPRSGWKKFRYTCHFNRPDSDEMSSTDSFVYCQNKETFIQLVSTWNNTTPTKRWFKYTYTEMDALGVPINLKDIPADQNFKVKVLLTYNGHEGYIQ